MAASVRLGLRHYCKTHVSCVLSQPLILSRIAIDLQKGHRFKGIEPLRHVEYISNHYYCSNNPLVSRDSHTHRLYSTKKPGDKVKPPSLPRRYALNKLVNFLANHTDKLEKKLEKRFPEVSHIYQTAKTGIKLFIIDAKDYYRISRQMWSGESLSKFSRKELELFRQCSRDLPKMSIGLLIAFAPGGLLVFPLAYMFPRHMLSHHFWTPKQRVEFRQLQLREQLKHYSSVLGLMESKLKKLTEKDRQDMQHAISKVHTSSELSSDQILKLKPIFERKPFGADHLSLEHRYHAARSLGLPFLLKPRMVQDALLLHFIDMAMVREDMSHLNQEELDKACACRGLDPLGLDKGAKLEYLRRWTKVTTAVHEPNISLLLHLPVFLGYAHKSNQSLLRKDKT